MEKLVLYGLGAYVLLQVLNRPAAAPSPRPYTTSSPVVPSNPPRPPVADPVAGTVTAIAGAVGSVANLISQIYQSSGSDPNATAANSGKLSY